MLCNVNKKMPSALYILKYPPDKKPAYPTRLGRFRLRLRINANPKPPVTINQTPSALEFVLGKYRQEEQMTVALAAIPPLKTPAIRLQALPGNHGYCIHGTRPMPGSFISCES